MIEGTLTTVGKSNDGHGASSPSGDPYERPHGLGCASKRRPPGKPASQWQAPCRHPAHSRADVDHWKKSKTCPQTIAGKAWDVTAS
ncbi:hypothetical protein BWR15_15400 [Pseudomonas sp. T]|uniref:Uncharacterized protein n=1 Tax=Pseudomonas denitrificans TaxID=43306 RepID=A0A9X7MVY7_PSEDE|nr:hypothetical protein BWR15_15400 [Pseudomonas sp. T]QEY70712.1 hypothetical protein F1C79_03050 [Pseudomonas denitrificans (nom. rej.)]